MTDRETIQHIARLSRNLTAFCDDYLARAAPVAPQEPPEVQAAPKATAGATHPTTGERDSTAKVKARCAELEAQLSAETVVRVRGEQGIEVRAYIPSSRYNYRRVKAYEEALENVLNGNHRG